MRVVWKKSLFDWITKGIIPPHIPLHQSGRP